MSRSVMGTIVGEVDMSTKELEVEWKIKDFLSNYKNLPIYFRSPTFSFVGESWCFQMYPSVNSVDDEPIDLLLYKYTSGPPLRLDFNLSIKTVDGQRIRENHLSHVFDEGDEKYKYGVYKLITRSELIERKAELVPADILTIVSTLRCPRSTQDASVDCIPETSIVLHESKVLHDFKELFLKKEDCDVIIKVKGQEFPAHRAILRARSPVFASTYRYDTKEKETGIIDIEDCEPSSFSDFLCFLYCGDTDIVSIDNVFSLFTAADKYDVEDLRAKCVAFMKENLSVETFCDTITLALQHSETELITLATNFFNKHALKIAKTVKWQLFSAKNPIQSNELFIKALASKGWEE